MMQKKDGKTLFKRKKNRNNIRRCDGSKKGMTVRDFCISKKEKKSQIRRYQ